MASQIDVTKPVEGNPTTASQRANWGVAAQEIGDLQTGKEATGVAAGLVAAHAGNTSNPHSVTAAQVGADPTGTAAAAVGALASSLATVATSGAYADLSGKPTLGTAAPLNVPASGDAASGEVVKGNDSRLTNARTPTNLTGPVTSTGSATAIANGAITNAMLANSAVANLSGTNSGDETGARIGTLLHAATNKTTLVDADETTGLDSAASFGLIRTTWTNVKAFLKTYFDTLYAARLLTGYVSGAGTVAAGDTVLQAFQKLNGNDALKATAGLATASGLTMSTARLLGRTTASTGAIEEISVAGSLTLSGGVLTGTGGGANTALSNLASPAINVDLIGAVSGGMTISGGSAANDDLLLQGTTNATRTTSYVSLQPSGGNVGIGGTNPDSTLYVYKASNPKLTVDNGANFLNLFAGGSLSVFQFDASRRFGIQAGSSISDPGNASYSQMSFGSTRNTAFGDMAYNPTDNGYRVDIQDAGTNGALRVNGIAAFLNLIYFGQFTTGAAPTYVKGASYFDTTLNKLRIGGASAWETVTSV